MESDIQHVSGHTERESLTFVQSFDNVAGTTWAQSMQAGLQKQAYRILSKTARVQEGVIDALVSAPASVHVVLTSLIWE